MSTTGTPDDNAAGTTPADEELDRHRRRVLWALPTGLYLVGSRAGDEVNLMTANLVVQVCIDPKLVGVALERDSVTARLVAAGGSFAISLLARSERDVVRRFVKPVTEVERDPQGAVFAMSGHPVTEVGPDRLPVLGTAAGSLVCRLTRAEELGSHTLCIGEVIEVGGEPAEAEGGVLRMEDTLMHYGG
jgi:flavin reductase (DIM6/NTAB) family NADH-FMN oxidoreductase RutF